MAFACEETLVILVGDWMGVDGVQVVDKVVVEGTGEPFQESHHHYANPATGCQETQEVQHASSHALLQDCLGGVDFLQSPR